MGILGEETGGTDLRQTVERLERQLKIFKYVLVTGVIVMGLAFSTLTVGSESRSDTLRLRKLVITDDNGVERVIIGAPVPDPITLGKRFPRGGKSNGILLFDEDGNERSGYVTTDGYPNVLFTLDSLARQQVLFMTEPHGSTALWIWDQENNSFQLNVGGDEPELKVIKRGQEFLLRPEKKSGEGAKKQ